MTIRRVPFLSATFLVFALVLTGLTVQAAFDAAKQSEPPHAAPPKAEVPGPLPLAASGADIPGRVPADIIGWIEGVEREQAEREAAEMAAARSHPVGSVVGGGTFEGVGDCTGFAIPDAIIHRESRGDPFAVNASSGAFGCAQVMPMHWSETGACAGLDRYNIEDQRTCVGWLSEGGTRLSPWGGG